MGTVYEAIDLRLYKTVALKECHFTDERRRKQFKREAHLLAKLRHPAMPQVNDHFKEDDEVHFLVMDFVSGEDLGDRLQRSNSPFPTREVLKWADQLLDVLDYLHTQEPPIVHRDIKPQNLKLTERKQIILLDFGLAKGFAGQMSHVTTPDSLFGFSTYYSSLEQMRGTGTDARSDLYSLAATLYHLMTNVVPPDALARASASVSEQADPLRSASDLNPHVTPAIAAVLKQAMALNPKHRPATALEMREMLLKASKSLPALDMHDQDTIIVSPIDVSPAVTLPSEPEEDSPALSPTIADSNPPKLNSPPIPALPAPSIGARLARASHSPVSSRQSKSKPRRFTWLLLITNALLLIVLIISNIIQRKSADSSNVLRKGDPIKVGVYLDLTGQTASFGQSTRKGIELACAEINRDGIDGHKIQLIFENDAGDSNQAILAVVKLINEYKVHAILGEVVPSHTRAAAPKAQEAKIPMITPSSGDPIVTTNRDYIFRACVTDTFQGQMMARFAFDKLKARRAAILFDSRSDYSKELAKAFKSRFEIGGGKIVKELPYVESDRDFSRQLKNIRETSPDVIYIPGSFTEAGIIANQARRLDINVPLLGGDSWALPAIWDIGHEALNTTYITNHYAKDAPSDIPRKFFEDYNKAYNVEPDAQAALGYDAMKLLADALNRAKTVEGAKLRDAIAETKGFRGVTGYITAFDKDRNPDKPIFVLELQDGGFVYKGTLESWY
jgi:branched-chain amino acid transport system substrate-binding protein